ncbi:hypothetical protein MMC15_003966 [Xylographa vitiligo]|nr:hypothetical protein [Xylographa vitiligo]
MSSNSSTNTLDAERADRISRLAGLERVATARQGSGGFGSSLAPSSTSGPVMQLPPPGYFDNAGNFLGKERSTVGSASATGSVGGRTTWADGSDVYDADKMSEDQDDGISSAGLSDEGNASLVGFGEAASTTSGPVSNPDARLRGWLVPVVALEVRRQLKCQVTFHERVEVRCRASRHREEMQT